jgi:luciferase family oxidoreductase group 1
MDVSILDLVTVSGGSSPSQSLSNMFDLAGRADDLGFKRYWLSEHHNMPGIASSAPEILIGQVARATPRIRVGSGGIMLPNHSPLKVAEWFQTLEALFPGRIDLGIGRAPGTDPRTAMALRRSAELARGVDLPSQLADLFGYSEGNFAEGHPYKSVAAVPYAVPLPPVWLLGSSDYSAHVAAEMGLGFVYAHHINGQEAIPAMRAYREGFEASKYRDRPRAMLAVSAICAETNERADYLAASQDLVSLRIQRSERTYIPSPDEALAYPYTEGEREVVKYNRQRRFVGDPETVYTGIRRLARQSGADEVMIVSMVYDHSERVRSYELIAEAFGAGARSAISAEAGRGVA